MIALRVADDAPDAEQHRRALRDALGSRFVEECEAGYTDEALDCALAARDDDSARVCLISAPAAEAAQ